jgi:hypothetical protein
MMTLDCPLTPGSERRSVHAFWRESTGTAECIAADMALRRHVFWRGAVIA